MGKSEPLCNTGRNVKWCNYRGKHYSSSPKIETELHDIQQLPFWVYTKIIESRNSNIYLYTHVHSSIVHINPKMETVQASVDR